MIHSSSIIDPNAKISKDVEIGPYCIIGSDVEVGSKTKITKMIVDIANTKLLRRPISSN